MLTDAGQSGIAEAVLIEHGFSAEMLTSIARTGLATGRQRVRITDAGRRTLNEATP